MPNYGPKSELTFDHDLGDFAKRADISPFGPARLPIPKTGQVYNDDLVFPRCQKSARSSAGKHRNVLIDANLECLPYDEHARASSTSPFFLSPQTHHPPSAMQVTKFLLDCDPRLILKFRDAHLSRLGDLAGWSSSLESTWKWTARSQIAPPDGRVKLDYLSLSRTSAT